jgi:hypothetical protein
VVPRAFAEVFINKRLSWKKSIPPKKLELFGDYFPIGVGMLVKPQMANSGAKPHQLVYNNVGVERRTALCVNPSNNWEEKNR